MILFKNMYCDQLLEPPCLGIAEWQSVWERAVLWVYRMCVL